MFIVKEVTTVERYCPNGHSPLFNPFSSSSVNFCHACGVSILGRKVTYDAAYCADCNSPVNSSWNYCPYCGQAREC